MTIEVRRTGDALFTAYSDGLEVGRLRLAIGDGVWEAYSTNVSPEHEGHGIGARLARAMLEAARDADVTVIPSCWFIDGYITRHAAEFGDLRQRLHVEQVGSAEHPACRVSPAVLPPA